MHIPIDISQRLLQKSTTTGEDEEGPVKSTLSLLSVVGRVGYNSTGLVKGLAHQTHLQHVNDDGKKATFAPPTLPLCPSHLNPLPHTHQTTLDHPTVLFDIATQYKRDIPYTKDGTTTTQNKWPLATHTNTTVPDTPSSHLATTGHAHTHPRPNGVHVRVWRVCVM